ncbi:acyl-CoA Delta(11) desaturase-like [Pieris brassicae]|uniref:acyl-CoA Delta(11) desaturase-like n=1 Tax=Pieris brassicae TaxID=7116 RepID=UPI001E660A5C|nr:acyl-CoA Delta(11) desaturase-like [Pieris brassicae]
MTLNVEETTWEPSDVVGVPKVQPWKYVVVYGRVVTFGLLQIAAVYGLYLAVTCAYWKTLIFNNIILLMAAIGISAGNHRLWSHRAYKAKWPLQIILMIFTSMTYQFSIINWVRDHRLHHKYTDTDADPYNASRGLFFSHIGWLLVRKHPDVKKYGKNIDMIDIYGNPVLRFQKKYAVPIVGSACFLLPTFIPVYFWNENPSVAWHVCLLRYVISLNQTFLVNSFSHTFGFKPYDRGIKSTNNSYFFFLLLVKVSTIIIMYFLVIIDQLN